MYTAEITSTIIQKATKKVILSVDFSDGTDTHTQKFVFSLYEPIENMYRAIKRYVVQLEDAETRIGTITVGALDLSAIDESTQTQADIDRNEWKRRDDIRDQVDRAVAKGYLTGNETKVTQLKNWLTNNFKPEYLDLV